MTTLPGILDTRAAAERLSGLIVETPLIESPELNRRHGGRILFKPETLQRTGSFKIRGAYNNLARLCEEERGGGDGAGGAPDGRRADPAAEDGRRGLLDEGVDEREHLGCRLLSPAAGERDLRGLVGEEVSDGRKRAGRRALFITPFFFKPGKRRDESRPT